MTSPSIDVVIPAYNAAAFLRDALESIARQTYLPKSVTVVDDGSKDRTADVAESWAREGSRPFEFNVIRQANGGIAMARNAAIARASGEWIALLDADDIWLPNHLQELTDSVAAAPQACVAYGNGNLIRDGAVQDLSYDEFWDNPSKALGQPIGDTRFQRLDRRALPRLLRGNFIKPSSLMLARPSVEKWGSFDPQQRNAEDRELLARYLVHGHFVYSPTPITLYRWHEDNASQGKNAKRNMEFGLSAVLSIQRRFASEWTPDESAELGRILKSARNSYADVCAMHGIGRLVDGLQFLSGKLGAAQAMAVMTPRRLARSLLQSITN